MLIRWLLYVFIAYIALATFVYFFAENHMFHPPPAGYQDNHNIIKLTTQDGAAISAIYLPNKAATYTLLVSHGNAEDIGYMLPFLETLHDHGFAVFAYDYHGYGTSKGKPTEKSTYADVNAAYDYLTTQLHISPNHIIAYGRSIGAAVALDLAVHKPIAGLILESPFTTALRTVTQIPIFPFDQYNNLAKIEKITAPILVIHGTHDSIVPFWHGKKLYDHARTTKYFLTIENANHNNMATQGAENYWQAIVRFAKSLRL